MDITITPSQRIPMSTDARNVIVKSIIQYRDPTRDDNSWITVSDASQEAPPLLSRALRTPDGVRVSRTMHEHRQSRSAIGLQSLSLQSLSLQSLSLQSLSIVDELVDAGFASPANSNVPSLEIQDQVMSWISQNAKPGFLKSNMLIDLAGISENDAYFITMAATDSLNIFRRYLGGYIKNLTDAIQCAKDRLGSTIPDMRNKTCDILRAVVLDKETRGPIYDDLKDAEEKLKGEKDKKFKSLPSSTDAKVKANWVKNYPDIQELEKEIKNLRDLLNILPSQRAKVKNSAEDLRDSDGSLLQQHVKGEDSEVRLIDI